MEGFPVVLGPKSVTFVAETHSMKRTRILSSSEIEHKIRRIAHQINEEHYRERQLHLVGVMPQGFEVARRLHKELQKVSKAEILLYGLTMNKEKPWSTDMDFDGDLTAMKNKVVILIDDVLNSGKTLMYSSGFLMEANPKKMAVATLVDRIHRTFPIRADYVGLTLSTNLKEHVQVELDVKEEAAYLV